MITHICAEFPVHPRVFSAALWNRVFSAAVHHSTARRVQVLKLIDPGYKVRTYSKMSSITLEKYAQNRSYPGFEKEKEGTWNGPFVFIQGADTQLGMISTYLEKQQFCTWDKEIDLTTRSIEAINKMVPRPRFFVVCGDLVDAMPGNNCFKVEFSACAVY